MWIGAHPCYKYYPWPQRLVQFLSTVRERVRCMLTNEMNECNWILNSRTVKFARPRFRFANAVDVWKVESLRGFKLSFIPWWKRRVRLRELTFSKKITVNILHFRTESIQRLSTFASNFSLVSRGNNPTFHCFVIIIPWKVSRRWNLTLTN